MNVHELLSSSFKLMEIRLHAVNVESDGKEEIIHETYSNKLNQRLYKYRDYEVIQYKCVKANCIDIIAMKTNN